MNLAKVHPAFSRDALFSKSQVFISRGYRALKNNDFEEYQLWASLALELLAKSTLSYFSPALVANPNHCDSLFAACGHTRTPDVRSIVAHTLFDRLSKLSKRFDSHVAKFCKELSERRNSELHSGESPFSGMKPDHWEDQFWYTVDALLVMQGRDLASWLTEEDAQSKSQMLNDAGEARKKAIAARIKNRMTEFRERVKDAAVRASLLEKSKSVSPWSYFKRFGSDADAFDSETCPSCQSQGVVAGTKWDEQIIDETFDGDSSSPPEETVEISYVVEDFWCPICHLELKGTIEVEAAGIRSEFRAVEAREIEFEPEYGND